MAKARKSIVVPIIGFGAVESQASTSTWVSSVRGWPQFDKDTRNLTAASVWSLARLAVVMVKSRGPLTGTCTVGQRC
jgi:hypothetical protein